jgi:hypothetical protein
MKKNKGKLIYKKNKSAVYVNMPTNDPKMMQILITPVFQSATGI